MDTFKVDNSYLFFHDDNVIGTLSNLKKENGDDFLAKTPNYDVICTSNLDCTARTLNPATKIKIHIIYSNDDSSSTNEVMFEFCKGKINSLTGCDEEKSMRVNNVDFQTEIIEGDDLLTIHMIQLIINNELRWMKNLQSLNSLNLLFLNDLSIFLIISVENSVRHIKFEDSQVQTQLCHQVSCKSRVLI